MLLRLQCTYVRRFKVKKFLNTGNEKLARAQGTHPKRARGSCKGEFNMCLPVRFIMPPLFSLPFSVFKFSFLDNRQPSRLVFIRR